MAIRILHLAAANAEPITEFASRGAASEKLGDGAGDFHAYTIHFEAGGLIGPHPAGFDQLFLVVRGTGWIAGDDGVRHPIDAHHAAFVPTGELHSKGSEAGMTAIMIQVSSIVRSSS